MAGHIDILPPSHLLSTRWVGVSFDSGSWGGEEPMLRTSVFIRRRRNEPIGKCGPGRRSMRLAVGVSVVLVTLLAAACGSSDDSAPATASTAAATSAPADSLDRSEEFFGGLSRRQRSRDQRAGTFGDA